MHVARISSVKKMIQADSKNQNYLEITKGKIA